MFEQVFRNLDEILRREAARRGRTRSGKIAPADRAALPDRHRCDGETG